ncbi:hypothetical protein EKO04_000091 [Ascochyta lentis]|uniref:F-box domain-containing protein n=1 Tax=Ascochyta lentis TaxID=205686 RepID=A0A8H7JCV1_9PLEO|nr:hypothetical protein EKO04_000091 [Ascochyta lentis]
MGTHVNMAHPDLLGLIYLPNELLDAIVALLDQPSHYALALTCKATNPSASGALYSTYTNRDAPSKAPFHLFLRTLCERSELAAMVKRLDIRGWRSEFEVATGAPWQGLTEPRKQDKTRSQRTGPLFVSTSRPVTTVPKSYKLFEETAVEIGLISPHEFPSISTLKKTVIVGSTLKKREDFARLLRHGVEDAQIVLMLALLPNVAALYIDGMSVYSTLDWHYFLKQSDTALRALRTVRICGQLPLYNGQVHTATFRFLELTPELEHLSLSHVIIEAPHQGKSLMSNRKLLFFSAMDAQINGHMLRNMLSGQRLEVFQYRPGGHEFLRTHLKKFSEEHIVDCLMDSRQSLRELKLYSKQWSTSPLLSQFDNLEYMEMPFAANLFNVTEENDPSDIANVLCKRIPNSLSTLSLRYILPSDAVGVVMAVLADLKHQGRFSALKTVRLNVSRPCISLWFPLIPYDDFDSHLKNTLVGIFEKVGLQLEVAQTD